MYYTKIMDQLYHFMITLLILFLLLLKVKRSRGSSVPKLLRASDFNADEIFLNQV